MPVASAGGGSRAESLFLRSTRGIGTIIRINENDFLTLVSRCESPLVLTSRKGSWSFAYEPLEDIFRVKHRYLMPYKGIVFCTKTKEPLSFSKTVELIELESMILPPEAR
jgi:hypothetical protein